MMTRLQPIPRTALAAAAVAAACSLAVHAQAAGRAEVSFADPQRYSDAGFGSVEVSRTQRLVAGLFDRVAARLPDGQVLQVRIDDIDLAGEIEHFVPNQPRVMGRVPDAPRLEFAYTLRSGGRVLAEGRERLTDLSYLYRGSGKDRSAALPYEQRMVDGWFAARLAPVAPAQR